MSLNTSAQPDLPAITGAKQRVLICGHRAFAARGLDAVLTAAGHDVWTYTRGAVHEVRDRNVSGPILEIDEATALPPEIDVVINYVLLKDRTITDNDAYLDSLLRLCAKRNVKHLIHLSSVSAFSGDLKLVTEDSPVETVPLRKGSYGSLKVAADQYLERHAPTGLPITFLRPGFIIGDGMTDPIVGMGVRMGSNRLLLIGDAANQLPVTTRDMVHDVIRRLVGASAVGRRRSVLVLSNNSPTRRQWLEACCAKLGVGERVVSFPRWFWRLAGLGGAPVARLARMSIKPNQIMRNVCRRQRFDATKTERELGLSLDFDWQTALGDAFDLQRPNFRAPYDGRTEVAKTLSDICYVGFGQVVKQKHLPALRREGFSGSVTAFDVRAGRDAETGIDIQLLADATLPNCDLVIVASPGPVHTQSIDLLKSTSSTIVVEKPLCYTHAELQQWLGFARSRASKVYVCHNYRFKTNVRQFLSHIARYNPGCLIGVDILFQSPSIAKEWRTWTKDERAARTLLMDYSVHLLDLACMFSTNAWRVDWSDYTIDKSGYTGMIRGKISSPEYPVNFTLRQGFIPRVARIAYTFQNYVCMLSLFPDTFVPHMSDAGAALHKVTAKAHARAFRQKVWDKLTHSDRDTSHALMLNAAAVGHGAVQGLSVQSLEGFYHGIFSLADQVYGQ